MTIDKPSPANMPGAKKTADKGAQTNGTPPAVPQNEVADNGPQRPQDTNEGREGIGYDDRDTRSGLKIERSRPKAPGLDVAREVPLHERDDAPTGSTESSELVYEDGRPVRVSGPTHYSHLANGEIVGTYGIGTHHDSGDGPVPVVAHYQG